MTSNYTVTVLGLGAMGLPMATRMASQLTVHGFDIAEPRLKLAEEAGITTYASAREAAKGADAVLLAVRNGEQLNDVLFGGNGVASVLEPGAVVILGSTVGTEAIPATVAKLAEYGVELVDAPLSGGPKRAGEGDLLIVVGASPEAREKAAPALELLASTLTVVGDKPGDGQALKTVNQLLCGVHIAAAAEAMALADALGLDQAKTLAALEAGAAGSFMLSNRGPRIPRGVQRGRRRGPVPPGHFRQGHGHRGQGHPRRRPGSPGCRRRRAALPAGPGPRPRRRR
ncbi:3-hydroxyisobutyrate dehydrogenase [Arthrobacter sp. V1I9]|nr:3-hydroxyisobutyrate dehydrogenase [Arthrobacter sp. V1I9]